MSSKYKEFSGLNLPAMEQEVLAKWQQTNAFEKSVELREGATPFVFYEGPPSANGMPGIHHVISRTLKDLVCRYKTMQGYQVKRKGGWDTHGLPVELGVEKMLGITKEDIGKKISVAEYNETCRREVLKYKDKWDDITTKIGYWVDLNDPYVTFKNEYIETLWWVLKSLYNKGYLYESVSIQPYSPAAGTGLSSHELNQPGTYKDVKDTSVVAMFRASPPPEGSGQAPEGGSTNPAMEKIFQVADAASENPPSGGRGAVFFLAWTTTPWTLPSNLGLTVGPNIEYVLVKTFNPYTHLPINVIMAKTLINKYFKPEAENGDFDNYSEVEKVLPWKVLTSFKGKDIEGVRYEQLLPFEANSQQVSGGDPFRVLCDTFVTTEDGTGIVHTAPAFGADDFKVGKKYGIGILTMVDREGKFVVGMGEFSNRFVKNYKDDKDYQDVNVDISVKLKKENRAFKVEKYEHSYPHCWRTDKPILYYPLDAWFIKTTAVKERMVELNKTINWKPKSTGEGRFGNWLENMVDWNLSRSRYWGTPLPIWKTEDGSEQKCIGSIEELMREAAKATENLGEFVNKQLSSVTLDLHKPYVDDIILVSESGKPMNRVPDLVDVWFDSGAMPFAQWHFPFENQQEFANNYPADFIAEGVDQTRGWFYTLHAISALMKETVQEELIKLGIEVTDQKYPGVAYKTVVSNGLVLDKNGNKMSKRLGNVVDPFATIEKFGADATRWYLITNASPWDSLKFDLGGIQEIQRKFFGTLYNTYQFFALYSNVDGFAFKEAYIPLKDRPEIDRWILSSLNSLVKAVTASMDDYEPTQAGRAIEDFVDEHLSNWYVRLCRRRFWKGEYEHDKICAYQTLYECLETVLRLMAPISPFFSDAIFGNLNAVTGRFAAESIHHADFPLANPDAIDLGLEERMQLAQDISSLVLSLRKKVNIKVRQPLQKVLIPLLNPDMKTQLVQVEELIKSEVNVKEIEYLTETAGFINKKIKPNFVALGKRLGPKMKAVSAAIAGFDQARIINFEKDSETTILIDNETILLKISDVDIIAEDIPGWSVAVKGNITVALDISLSESLQREGLAREFVNRIQNIRKESGFDLTDRINIIVGENSSIRNSINEFKNYICAEILADNIDFAYEMLNGKDIEVNEIKLKVSVTKKHWLMAKQTVKAAKTAPKPAKIAPKAGASKKAVPEKKSVPVKAEKGKPIGEVVPNSEVKLAKPSPELKKQSSSSVSKKTLESPKPVAKKAAPVKAASEAASKKSGGEVKKTSTTEKGKSTAKEEVSTSSKSAAAKNSAEKKPVIVPPKPAINPKPEKKTDKKVESSRSAKVVIPKTSTDKKVHYDPEFTKSVLDTPELTAHNSPITRYSDVELNEFRDLINKKLDAAKKELGYLQGLITRKDEMGGDESDNRYMTMEDGSMSMEREQLSQMASRQITFIDHLEKAIMRIENKTYGICRVTGKLIDKARLRAVPHATLSMEAKMGINR